MHICNSVGLNVAGIFAGAGFITQGADLHWASHILPCLIVFYVISWNIVKLVTTSLIYSNSTGHWHQKNMQKEATDSK